MMARKKLPKVSRAAHVNVDSGYGSERGGSTAKKCHKGEAVPSSPPGQDM